ncbi:protein NRT1/ PTR FAMILY 4.3-like [Andrographis paniculata]|uniref:protein NRT1/ PTR FAMILY 4.3-like n=1 Tax=Andrographis paniculata TaxID=175694 RepID=UPI0021E888C5|nr:protein NRT1/ PTR FAMILY 4.3-like [Andrographis paniculata]
MEMMKGERVEEMMTVDWRGRPSNPLKHGGMRAAAFVLGVQGFEIMAIAAVGNNLITYLINEMHFSLSKSANTVTNFVGTVFLLALLGGYLSDSHLGCFWTMLIFAFLELSGFILLSVQAHLPQLKPPKCETMMTNTGVLCEEATGFKALIFFVALYLVALGSGCVKPNMIAHGADQFSQDNPKQSKNLSRYFNAAYFAFSVGELLALTLLVYVQTHSGMDVGFGVSAAAMAMGLIALISGTLFYRNKPPQGSILTPIAQVVVAAILKRKQVCPSDPRMLQGNYQKDHLSDNPNLQLTQRFRFLNKGCIKNLEEESPWRLCSVGQVEQVKILISMLPIFACTIVFNTLLAQLQTFSVQQGAAMDARLPGSSFKVPPASLQAIPYLLLIFLVPLYDAFFVPFARRFTGHASGITAMQRIGAGLFLGTFSMVAAAVMESRRRSAAVSENRSLSIFWIAPQFLIFGVSEMFTAVGLVEFFYKQAAAMKGMMMMQSFLTAVTYCSYSFGFFLSSVLVSLVNKVTAARSPAGGGGGWLGDNNLNKDRLDLFYWLLAGLSFLNFLNYLFWGRWYSKNRREDIPATFPPENEDKDAGDINVSTNNNNVYRLNEVV